MFNLPPSTPKASEDRPNKSGEDAYRTSLAWYNSLSQKEKDARVPPTPKARFESLTPEKQASYNDDAEKAPQFAAHAPFNWPTANGNGNGSGESTTQQPQSPNNQPAGNIFGNTAATVNPSQSAQPASNIFRHLGSQPKTQQPQQSPSNMFRQSMGPSQQATTNVFGQNMTQSQQTASNAFGQESSQPQRPASNLFGKSSPQSQQSMSSLFGQNLTQPQQSMSNMFGPKVTQPQQMNASAVRNEDSMSTSPDNSPQNSAEKNAGPFAFLNTPATSSQGSSLFERTTNPPGTSTFLTEEGQSDHQTPGQEKPKATQPLGGGLFDRISKPPGTSNVSLGGGQGATQDVPSSAFASDPYELLKNKPVYSKPATSPTKSPPRPRANATSFAESHRKVAAPTFSLPTPQDGKTAINNPFTSIKFPPNPKPTSEPISSPSIALTLTSDEKDLSLSANDRTVGMPPPAPPEFTDEQKRELVTGYRLKALDVGLRKRLVKSQASQTESEALFRFYQEKKQAIINSGGLPLESIVGNKRKSTNETQIEGSQDKRAKLDAPSLQISKPQSQVANGSALNSNALSDSQKNRALSPKRKADEDMNRDIGQGIIDSAKRARNDRQISYPSLSTSSNSQTSSIFKNILGGKEEAPAYDTSEPSVNGSKDANASDLKRSSATVGNSFQSKPSSTSNNSNPFAASTSQSKVAPTASILHSSNPVADSPSKSIFAPVVLPSFPANARPFSIKPGSTKPLSEAPLTAMISTSSTIDAKNPFSFKPNTSETTPSAVVKSPTFKPPTFATGGPSNFLSQFGKTAEETAKKEKEKRKAEDFDSDEDDEAEWERKDAEEQRAKKQKLEEALMPKKAKFIPGKGFVLGNDITDELTGKSPQSNKVDRGSSTATPSKDSSTSIFINQSTTQGLINSPNIFGHLSDVDSAAEGSKTGDADDEDESEVSDYDKETNDHSEIKNVKRASAQQNDPKTSEKAPAFAPSNSFVATNDPRLQGRAKPTSEGQPPARSLFDRISKDDSGGSSSEAPPAEQKKSEDASKPSLFPTNANNFVSQSTSLSSGSTTIPGLSSPSKPASNLFGQSPSKLVPNIFGSATQSTPTSNFLGQQSLSTPANKDADSSSPSPGDHTWKPDTPIKFGASSNTPGVQVTSPSPSKSSFGGLFGSPQANAAQENTAKPTSSIFSTSPAKSPSVGFGFAFGGPPKPATSTLAPLSGAVSDATSRATSPGASTAGESANESTAEGGNELMEHHEQIDFTSGGPGEEDEDVVFEARAKAQSWASDQKEWVSKGVGIFRVLKHRGTSKTRMLMRQETIGKIILNAALLSAMKYEYAAPKSVKMAVASDNGKLATWFVRVGQDDDAQKLASVLEENKSN